MFNMLKRFISIMKNVNIDTHLWCVSVLGGAVLLCVSFFVDPSSRVVNEAADDTITVSRARTIEYGSVLGSLSSSDILEDEEVLASFDEYYNEEEGEEEPDEVVNGQAGLPELVEEKVTQFVATNDFNVDLSRVYSPETLDVLERLVQCEAGCEDMEGRTLVANVVLNRVNTGIWGDDIMSVIMAEGQFDPIGNGAYKVTDADSVTKKAVINALMGQDDSQGAIYFQKSNAKIWGDKKYLFRHGSHSFYK